MPKHIGFMMMIPFIGMLLISENKRIKAEGRVAELIEDTESFQVAVTSLRNRVGALEVMAEQTVLTTARWEIRRQVIAQHIEDEWKAARLNIAQEPCHTADGVE